MGDLENEYKFIMELFLLKYLVLEALIDNRLNDLFKPIILNQQQIEYSIL